MYLTFWGERPATQMGHSPVGVKRERGGRRNVALFLASLWSV